MPDWRLRTIPASATAEGTSEMTTVVKLYQLAVLVYLNRVSENLLGQPARTPAADKQGLHHVLSARLLRTTVPCLHPRQRGPDRRSTGDRPRTYL
ncbi:hypothetical protein K432DRAFT_460009 [Lepidopterella palustris CBS 459.81]|uniref:Uncharacterized protein n=1 Tax=Lepidopterella palustris CBS 459.81 TaxID=1314670 RepID=A0A8E2E5J1_9PEZI|nr:hypothetical protein K432DRAFT_460009 [Lepidopterella palustris CBS 459.81]